MIKQKNHEKPNNANKKNPNIELVILINNLNSAIKTYYLNTMQIILNLKENLKNRKKNNINDVIDIENQLFYFIKEAKDLFKKIKIAKEKSLLEEAKAKNNPGQLYNYCNNNFFYYSNFSPNVNNNPNYFTKISNYGHHQKINYNSPKKNTTINFNHNKIKNSHLQKSYQKLKENENGLFNNNSNNLSKDFNKTLVIPKLYIEKKINKEELLKNLLNLLKQMNNFNCKVFYETEEAQNYKNIFFKTLEELNKLIVLLSKETINKNIKSLTERNPAISHIQTNDLNENNMNSKNKYNKILRNARKLKPNSNTSRKINKSCNIFNSRNIINKSKNFFSIQNMKSKSIIERRKTKSENSLNLEEIIKSKIVEKEKIKLINAGQQTVKIDEIKEISKEISMYFNADFDNKKVIKDLENKINFLNENILKANNEINFYKNENEKQEKYIENMNKEINILKSYLEKKEKKSNLIYNINIQNNTDIQSELDKSLLKYELLKLDYEKQKINLEEKEKLLNNYNLYTNPNESKNYDERINQLIKKHETEIENLNKEYLKNINELKMNLPNCFSPITHEILLDKKFEKYQMHWYLLTITDAKQKDYENTFWVSEDEIKSSLKEFKKFKSEEDIEKESINVYLLAQQKLINRIDENEETITNLKKQILKLKNSNIDKIGNNNK